MKVRQRISRRSHSKDPFIGEVELDESYFGARRIRGKGQVYVEMVANCSKESLLPIIQGKILEGSTVYTDGWKAYAGLILNGYDHYRAFHSENEFARGKNHINGIESFWSFAKRRLSKFNGLTDPYFFLHLKETEFRFNHRNKNLYLVLLSPLRKYPI